MSNAEDLSADYQRLKAITEVLQCLHAAGVERRPVDLAEHEVHCAQLNAHIEALRHRET